MHYGMECETQALVTKKKGGGEKKNSRKFSQASSKQFGATAQLFWGTVLDFFVWQNIG